MKTLDPCGYSALTILNLFGAYLLARLRATPLLEAVAAVAQAAQDALFSALQLFWSAQQARMAAASARDALEYRLDGALRGLRTAVMFKTHNDRRSKLYRALFSDGFGRLVRRNPAEKLVRVRKILVQLAEFECPELAHATGELQAASDALSASMAGYDAAQEGEQEASGALVIAKRRYCSRYEEIYHQLAVILGERRQAESYFRRVHRRRADEVVELGQVEESGQVVEVGKASREEVVHDVKAIKGGVTVLAEPASQQWAMIPGSTPTGSGPEDLVDGGGSMIPCAARLEPASVAASAARPHPAPPLGADADTLPGIGIVDAGFGQPPLNPDQESRPGQAVLLAPPPQAAHPGTGFQAVLRGKSLGVLADLLPERLGPPGVVEDRNPPPVRAAGHGLSMADLWQRTGDHRSWQESTP